LRGDGETVTIQFNHSPDMSNSPANLYTPPQQPKEAMPSVKWQIATPDQAAVDRLVGALDLSPITAALLVNRGVSTPDAARAFLAPDMADLSDPYRLPDMEAAVDRLAYAVASKERSSSTATTMSTASRPPRCVSAPCKASAPT
jgi:hypothetical protein